MPGRLIAAQREHAKPWTQHGAIDAVNACEAVREDAAAKKRAQLALYELG